MLPIFLLALLSSFKVLLLVMIIYHVIFLSHILCFRSCTAITGLLEHNMANIRTTITKVLVLITGGAIMSYKAVKNKEIRQISP